MPSINKQYDMKKQGFLRYWGRAGVAKVHAINNTHIEIESMGTGIAVAKDEINGLIEALRAAKRNM